MWVSIFAYLNGSSERERQEREDAEHRIRQSSDDSFAHLQLQQNFLMNSFLFQDDGHSRHQSSCDSGAHHHDYSSSSSSRTPSHSHDSSSHHSTDHSSSYDSSSYSSDSGSSYSGE